MDGYVQRGVGISPVPCLGGRGLYHGIWDIPPSVLTPNGSYQNTCGWQSGGTHPTGMLSWFFLTFSAKFCCFFVVLVHIFSIFVHSLFPGNSLNPNTLEHNCETGYSKTFHLESHNNTNSQILVTVIRWKCDPSQWEDSILMGWLEMTKSEFKKKKKKNFF